MRLLGRDFGFAGLLFFAKTFLGGVPVGTGSRDCGGNHASEERRNGKEFEVIHGGDGFGFFRPHALRGFYYPYAATNQTTPTFTDYLRDFAIHGVCLFRHPL